MAASLEPQERTDVVDLLARGVPLELLVSLVCLDCPETGDQGEPPDLLARMEPQERLELLVSPEVMERMESRAPLDNPDPLDP